MTDEQVLARAEAAGWSWTEAPNEWGKDPGWRDKNSFFYCRTPESKVERARRSFDHERNCQECNLPKDACYDHVSRTHCFDCDYWLRLVCDTNPSEQVIVNGVHFIAGGWCDKEPAYGTTRDLGFGGRKFVVKFTSGPNKDKILTTYDMWHQGKIPERFRDRLPDNAEFVENTSAVQPR